MKSKMIMDNYETVIKARQRSALLNIAVENFTEDMMIEYTFEKARKGFSIYAEFDKESYPTFDDVCVATRKASIAYRKKLREEESLDNTKQKA